MIKNIFFLVLLNQVWGFSQSYTLTVTNGYGDGNYSKGEVVHGWSDPVEANNVFSHWSGSGANYLNTVDEWHVQLNVPTGVNEEDILLTANYEQLGAVVSGQYDFSLWGELEESGTFFPTNKIVDYTYPANPKAIVFLIHGTGGNSSSWVERYDRRSIIKDLVHDGYAVFALNSNETTLGDQNNDGKIRWETDPLKQDTSTNIDFKNLIETRDLVFDELGLDVLPIFLIGGSNGANFSDFATAALDFKASCHMTGNGITALFEHHPNLKPIIWIQSKNDNQANADSTQVRANYNQLVSQGITTEWHWLERSPVHPFRFERSRNNIDSDLSEGLFNELEKQQLLDSNNFLNILDLNADFPFDHFYSFFSLSNLQKRDIEDQLNVINADHGANGDFNKTIIRFFNSCLLISSTQESKQQEQFKVRISPNPSFNELNLKSLDSNQFDYEIFSINSLLVQRANYRSTSHQIDISALPKGLYFIKMTSDSGTSTTMKFVKN